MDTATNSGTEQEINYHPEQQVPEVCALSDLPGVAYINYVAGRSSGSGPTSDNAPPQGGSSHPDSLSESLFRGFMNGATF